MQTLVLGNILNRFGMLPQRVLVPLTQDLVAEDGYNPDPTLEIEEEKLFTVFNLALTFQKIKTFQCRPD